MHFNFFLVTGCLQRSQNVGLLTHKKFKWKWTRNVLKIGIDFIQIWARRFRNWRVTSAFFFQVKKSWKWWDNENIYGHGGHRGHAHTQKSDERENAQGRAARVKRRQRPPLVATPGACCSVSPSGHFCLNRRRISIMRRGGQCVGLGGFCSSSFQLGKTTKKEMRSIDSSFACDR